MLGSTVLGPALAFVLPFGAEMAALAQSAAKLAPAGQPPAAQTPASVSPPSSAPAAATAAPSATGADALKARDQELNAALARQRDSAQNQAKLRSEIDALGQDRAKFNRQLIDTAARIRDVEANIDATQARLTTAHAVDWVRALPIVEKLAGQRRADHRELIDSVTALLRTPGARPALMAGLASGPVKTRRACFRIAFEADDGEGLIGSMFHKDFSIKIDPADAARWSLAAAEQGQATAQARLTVPRSGRDPPGPR